MRALCLVFYLSIFLFTHATNADEITIAVASNFTKPMQYLVNDFELTTGDKVRLSFGSSGKLYAQIVHGAPYHAFFSADQTKIDALAEAGVIVESSRFTYAVGQLALWSSAADVSEVVVEKLKGGNFSKLALANPKVAPYGAAAMQVLASMGLLDSTRPKWVLGENIAQTYQFIYSRNAELGFVALSQLSQSEILNKKTTWLVPPELHAPINQDAVLLRFGENAAVAMRFMKYMKDMRTKEVIASFGYKMNGINDAKVNQGK